MSCAIVAALTLVDIISLRLTSRTIVALGSALIVGSSSRDGFALVSGDVAARTRNCMT